VKRQVEIVGAGIAGLTTGLAFAQKGWRVRVHEQNSTLALFREGVQLWRNGLRVLDALGLLDPVLSSVIPAACCERRDAHGKTFSNAWFAPDCYLYLPLQRSLVTALYDALIETGGEVVFASRAVGADPDGRLEFAHGRRVRADLIIAADGINSVIRDSLGLLKRRRAAHQFGYRAVIRRERGTLDTDTEGTHWEYWSGSRRLLYAPGTAEFAHVELTSVAGDASGNAVPIDRQSWHTQFPKLAWIIDRLPEDGRGEWFETIRPEYWSSGRVAIIGDAATAQSPILGHGVGCMMMSAFALAQTIERTRGVAEGLVEWELRERPLSDWAQWVAYRYGQLAFFSAEARTAALKALDASRWIRRRILLGPVHRDVTGTHRYARVPSPSAPICPLMH
jgi:2-polyprenyl-6-methoxyphenol hydroxylase-like FAD-dependent oxidoreductase